MSIIKKIKKQMEVLKMPVITIETCQIDKAQKEALVKSFTKTAGEILKLPPEAFVILIKENDPDNIGSGGKLLTQVFEERKQNNSCGGK